MPVFFLSLSVALLTKCKSRYRQIEIFFGLPFEHLFFWIHSRSMDYWYTYAGYRVRLKIRHSFKYCILTDYTKNPLNGNGSKNINGQMEDRKNSQSVFSLNTKN